MPCAHFAAHDLPAQRIAETEAFIRANLPLKVVQGTGLRLHLAGPRSRLSRLVPPGGTPYWAHAWPGGTALAMHLLAHPGAVRGSAVLEIGAGSGLVSLAALRAGAEAAVALDSDPLAAVAVRLNADANGLARPLTATPAPGSLPHASLPHPCGGTVILAGDVFYEKEVARWATETLDFAAALPDPPASILVGDIGRRFLPYSRLEPLASYLVRDVGDPPSAPLHEGWVFRWRRP